MDSALGRLRFTIRMTVLGFFLLATGLTASLAIGLQYHFSRDMAHTATSALFTVAANDLVEDIERFESRNRRLLELLASNPLLADTENRKALIPILAQALQADPLLYSLYLGTPDGGLFQLASLDDPEIRQRQAAQPGERWLLVEVRNSQAVRERNLQFLSDTFEVMRSASETTDYDVRRRVWYYGAVAASGVHRSSPYLFAQTGMPGQTLSTRVAESDTVVALDVTLEAYRDWLANRDVASGAELYLYRPDGLLVASHGDQPLELPGLPVPDFTLTPSEQSLVDALGELAVSNEMDWPPYDYALEGEPQGYSVDVVRLISQMTGLRLRFINGLSWEELVAQFRAGDLDLLHAGMDSAANRRWALLSEPYAQLPQVLATLPGDETIVRLDQLGSRTLTIPRGWSIQAVIREHYPDLTVIDADSTLDALQKVLRGEAFATLDNGPIMRYLQRHHFLGELQWHADLQLPNASLPDRLHVMVQPDQPELLALINRAIAAIGPPQRKVLEERWLTNKAPGEASGTGAVPHDSLLQLPDDPQRAGSLQPVNYRGTAWYAFAVPAGDLRFGILIPENVITAPLMGQVLTSVTITAGLLLLLLPLSWLFAGPIVRPIRQLAEENDKVRERRYGDVRRIPSHIREIDELSASMATMAAAVQAYEKSQHDLMDAIIRVIAQAIDDKSPYTASHCERVPELAMMLARHASRSARPPFADFRLDSEDEWREFRIAAWLHDCGKITTPEHIVDKGSKLEAIYNRLHEIRMRFEVLWRDAEIDCLKATTAAPDREAEHRAECRKRQAQLQEEFRFVADCNVGGEHLDEEARMRLQAIAARQWLRHFSNRIGLSPPERQRLGEADEQLPVHEQLLADRPEHCIPHRREQRLAAELGIQMQIPQWEQNLGELHNLGISRGTLTPEDRFRIQSHMISTVKMLEGLPFPEELARVPRYATTHHETLRGDGYPRRLPGETLSIPERLLAIADVFEALTAADRPYKSALPLSKAVEILSKMVEENHLDRDGFELFLREGVYLDYARRFLLPEQIDEVPVHSYLSH